MKTIEQLSELILNDEHVLLLLGAPEIQPFLTKAVQHQFGEQATRYFFDKKNRELFKDKLMLSTSLYGDLGLETNLTKEQVNAYKKRRNKLSDGSDLIYNSPKDPDIIELPRLDAKAWDKLFSELLSEVGPSSSYHEQLLNNYSLYREGSSSESYIRDAILGDIQDEVLIMNFDYLITLSVNEVIFAFLCEYRLNDNKEDLFNGISVFELSDVLIYKTDEDRESMLEMATKLNTDLDKIDKPLEEMGTQSENDNNDDSNVSNWLWGISFIIIINLIINYFNLLE